MGRVWFLLTLLSPGVPVGSTAMRFGCWAGVGTAGKTQGLPWEEILNLGAVVALPLQPLSQSPLAEMAMKPSSSTFWVILKLPDKQKLHCQLITLFGKNRAALALQRKGLVTWRPGERAQGCSFPVEECVFGECCPGGSWNLKHPYLLHLSLADAAP